MNHKADKARYHAWLAARAPHATPPGLLEFALAELERNPRRARRWSWPSLRAIVLVPSVATVIVVTVVIGLVLNMLPERPLPIAVTSASPSASAEASDRPTGPATASGWASATLSPSPSFSPTLSPSPTPTVEPTPTPIVFPTPRPTPAPQIVGPPGTLTFRLVLASLPADTSAIILDLLPPEDIWMELTPPLQDWGYLPICGGSADTPCTTTTYEVTVSGFEPNAWIGFDYQVEKGPDTENHLLAEGMRRANGSLVVMSYPVPDPAVAWDTCAWDVQHHQQASGQIRDYTGTGPYLATANMCIWYLVWEPKNGIATTGTASLVRDGQPVYSIHLADFGDLGPWYGASSGYVLVVLPAAIPVARGQTLDLAFSGCPSCSGNLGLSFRAGVR